METLGNNDSIKNAPTASEQRAACAKSRQSVGRIHSVIQQLKLAVRSVCG